MCLDSQLIVCSIVVLAASRHYKGAGSIPQGGKCILLVATELAYKSNTIKGHSPEYLRTSRGTFGDIPQNRWRHSPECLATFPGMFYKIPPNVLQNSPECLAAFPECFTIFLRMLEDIPWNVWGHSPECWRTFPGTFYEIPRNVWRHSLEYLATFPGMFCDILRNVLGPFPAFPTFRSLFLYSCFYT